MRLFILHFVFNNVYIIVSERTVLKGGVGVLPQKNS